jgi:hypothetical protein
MKKVLFVLSLFISAFAEAQVTALPKASTAMPFGYLDVRYYGAVGDSSTDNTTAFRACAADAARLHTGIYIPSGNWVISDSIIISPSVSVIGMGGDIVTNDEAGLYTGITLRSAPTNILFRGNNKDGLVINPIDTGVLAVYNPGSDFRDFAIWYQGTTPTTNSGIKMVDGGQYKMTGVSIVRFYINLNVLASSYPSLVGCTFAQPAYADMVINNSVTPDNGGTEMTNCTFLSGNYPHAYAGLVWRGSGGIRMSNCEFNLSDLVLANTWKYCVVLQDASPTSYTQEIYLNNISFSTFDSCGLKADSLIAGDKGIIISNIDTYSPINASTRQAVIQVGCRNVAGTVQNITVSNIHALSVVPPKTGFSVPVCKFVRCTDLHVSGIGSSAYFTGGPAQYVSCGAAYEGIENLMGSNVPNSNNASGTPILTTLRSNKDVNIQLGNSTGPAGIFSVSAANNGFKVLAIDTLNRTLVNTGGSFLNFNFADWTEMQIEKDTAKKAFAYIGNANASGWAGLGVQEPGVYGFLAAVGASATGYKNINVGDVGVYSNTNIKLLSDGASGVIALSNINVSGGTNEMAFNSTGQLGINLGEGAYSAWVDIAGFNGFTTLRIEGQTSDPSSLVEGGMWTRSDVHHLYASLGGVKYQLDQQLGSQTLDQVMNTGSTLTANRAVALNGFAFGFTGLGGVGIGTGGTAGSALFVGIAPYNGGYGTGVLFPSGTSNDPITAASGTVTNMATNRVQQATFTATNTGVVYTNSASLVIDGPPIASTNVTQTNAYSLEIVQGNSIFNGDVKLGTAGNALRITEGSNGRVGQVALVSGTKAITITGLTTSSRAFLQLVSQGGTVTTTVNYEGVCTSNTLTINAVTNAGNTLNTLDGSTLNYFVVN